MNFSNMTMIATAAFGLEGIVAAELKRLGMKDVQAEIGGGYDVVLANIVADVIIRLLPDVHKFMTEDGSLIISGIIDIRKEDIFEAVRLNGFTVTEERYKDNWCAFVLKK